MSTVNLSNLDKGKSTVTLLEEVHRPLDEHWAVNFKYTLDPKASDYIYKHHLSHLEDIYQNRKLEIKEPPRKLIMSPVSQLYGVHGVKSNRPVQKQVEKARETKWVPNFQKHRYLDDKLHEQIKQQHKEQTQARNPSPGALNRKRTIEGKINDDINFEEAEEEEQLDTTTMHFSRKSTNQEINDTDLIMFGMYRLNTEQEEIYRKFVDMLTGFSQFDKESIVEDALHEACHGGPQIEDYGGTWFEDANV